MDKKLPNNITIKGLRRLREAYKDFLGSKVAVSVELDLWNHSHGEVDESITIWDGVQSKHIDFQSLKEAYKHLNKLKKERADANAKDNEST